MKKDPCLICGKPATELDLNLITPDGELAVGCLCAECYDGAEQCLSCACFIPKASERWSIKSYRYHKEVDDKGFHFGNREYVGTICGACADL